MTRLSRAVRAAAVALAAAGCATPPPPPHPTVNLAGTVTVGDAKLKTGAITFTPADPTPGAGPVMAAVADGRYAAVVPKGKLRVTFSSTPPAAANAPATSETNSKPETVIPVKYRSGLTIDADADNPNQNFDLTR